LFVYNVLIVQKNRLGRRPITFRYFSL